MATFSQIFGMDEWRFLPCDSRNPSAANFFQAGDIIEYFVQGKKKYAIATGNARRSPNPGGREQISVFYIMPTTVSKIEKKWILVNDEVKIMNYLDSKFDFKIGADVAEDIENRLGSYWPDNSEAFVTYFRYGRKLKIPKTVKGFSMKDMNYHNYLIENPDIFEEYQRPPRPSFIQKLFSCFYPVIED